MSNKPGVISGDYTFLNELQVKEIKAPNTNLEVCMELRRDLLIMSSQLTNV